MKPEIIIEEEDTLEKSLSEINRIKKAQAIAKIEQLNKEIDFDIFNHYDGEIFDSFIIRYKYLLMQNEVRKANRGCTRLKAKYERCRTKLEITKKRNSVLESLNETANKLEKEVICKCNGNGNKIDMGANLGRYQAYPEYIDDTLK